MFTIDPRDPTPLYVQLDRAIRAAIATGRLGPGSQLPTVRQLAVDLRVNANTVAKVYGELERLGVLATRRGVGTFVRDAAPMVEPREERERQLGKLADRYLTEAAALGFGAEAVLEALRRRITETGESDA